MQVDDDSSVNVVERFPIESIMLKNKPIKFKKPFLFDVSFEDDKYSASNEELGVLVVADSMKEVVQEIKEQIEIILEQYVDCSENQLTESAIKFRDSITSNLVK